MTRFVGYIAMSLDARIADAEGSVDWLSRFNVPGEDFGYAEFYAGVDSLVMGRATYEFVAKEAEWPYSGKLVKVVSGRPLETSRADVETVPPDFDALRTSIVGERDQTVWIVGGGRTQLGALDAGMFDELRLFVMPVVLGCGPLVFADGLTAEAELAGHKFWPGGVVELQYRF